MRASPLRALTTARLAAGASRTTSARPFHSTAAQTQEQSPGGKPHDDSVAEHDDDGESHASTEQTGGRTRNHASTSLRHRQNRRRQGLLPTEVKLPPPFLANNVSLYSSDSQPCLPTAIQEDSKYDKLSRLFDGSEPGTRLPLKTLESYFGTALETLLDRNAKIANEFEQSVTIIHCDNSRTSTTIRRVSRISDMVLDCAWHLVDSIYPARKPEYAYKIRPFWWWHIYSDLQGVPKRSQNHSIDLSASIEYHVNHAELFDFPLAQCVADLPTNIIEALRNVFDRDFNAISPRTFDPKVGKRPITILSTSGYGGTAISEAIGQQLAQWSQAHLVRLDAFDLSILLGDHLNQDWAYSRDAVSMMGFRAAEINGKLHSDSETLPQHEDDDYSDSDALNGLQASTRLLQAQLHRSGDDIFDSFHRRGSLKVDKVLEQVILGAKLKSPTSTEESGRPVLIHIHDIIEMSMTLEGAAIIRRLRALADAAWHRGLKLAVLGTSSCEEPSEEYQKAVAEFADTDLVITHHIHANRGDGDARPNQRSGEDGVSLQKADHFAENMRNINRMISSLSGDSSKQYLNVSDERVTAYLHLQDTKFSMLRDSILPASEVYQLASTVKALEDRQEGMGPLGIPQWCSLGHANRKLGQIFIEEERIEESEQSRLTSSAMNEYEKRIASGRINKEKLRTTFADVHAPPETISALRLLTSLALVRPDAFSYGVLAQDKIQGCLLYGPPGTGKTMLAKAVAKESGANMLEISGATINDKWLGESEKLIQAVFTLAKRLSPCVIFIDEADALLANRGRHGGGASYREHINQFLKEWDGMEEMNAFIMVATNRPYDLDDAVLRRLPRKLLVDLPLKEDRRAILQLLLKGETLDESVSLDDLARRTSYYSGSDLKNLSVAAAMAAVEEENEAASKHEGPQPFQYPERRTLRRHHFESALKQIPASISDDMASLKMIRKFDEDYGNRRRGTNKKTSMGFGVLDDDQLSDANGARIRPVTP